MSKRSQNQLLKTFQSLLRQHAALVRECSVPGEVMPWADVLEGFMAVRGRTELEERRFGSGLRADFEGLLRRYGEAQGAWMKGQRKTADDFNLIEVLEATHDELRHSAMLAWLLDRRMEQYGTHAQGSLGFRLFLDKLRLPAEYAQTAYWVRREVAGDKSRVDVEVAAYGHFIIHIENKLRAAEGDDQTDREWEDLEPREAALGISPSQEAVHALFLTPDGRPPQNSHFQAVSWSRIARVLEEFSRKAEPADVCLFAGHYARALRKYITTEYENQESRIDQETF